MKNKKKSEKSGKLKNRKKSEKHKKSEKSENIRDPNVIKSVKKSQQFRLFFFGKIQKKSENI